MEGLVERGSNAEGSTVVVNDEWQLVIWAVEFWKEEAGRYAGFGRDDDVSGLHLGFGV